MYTCANVNQSKVEREEIFVIWADIRESSKMNDKFNDRQLHNMYSVSLNEIYNILQKNGFENIDIQGDGIYGVSTNEKESLIKTIKEINNAIINDLKSPDNKNILTISINFGKEVYSCFGEKHENGQMAFFGNVVSNAKKWISNSQWNSNAKTRILMSKSAANKIDLVSNNELAKELNVSLKGNKKNKKYKGYY